MREFESTKWFNELESEHTPILIGYVGSKAHGTYRPPTDPNSVDDTDVMGLYIGSMAHYFGFGRKDVITRFEGKWDVVSYELKKFMGLLVKSNPNVISLLWLPENLYIKKTELGQRLIDNRNLFITKEAYKSYCGYAYSQLHKMEHLACEGYMGDKRKQLVEKFGYDTKNASHLVRLLRQGIELLSTGQLNVHREDNTYLLDIKDGKFKLDEIKAEATRLFSKMEEALIHSKLPNTPNKDVVEKLLVSILEDYFNELRYTKDA